MLLPACKFYHSAALTADSEIVQYLNKDNVLYRSVEFIFFGGHFERCGQLA